MTKITILALHLGVGGIEKAIITLANMLCDNYEIEIIATYKLDEKLNFVVDDRVKITYLIEDYKPNHQEIKNALNAKNPSQIIEQGIYASKVLRLKRNKTIEAIKQLDMGIVISTRIQFNNWLGKYGSKKLIKIGWEHSHHNNNRKYIKSMVSGCRNLDYLILVSKELMLFYQERIKGVTCVYLSHSLDKMPDKIASLNSKDLIAIGRLSAEKGFDDLIEVMELVTNQDQEVKLHLIGSGLEEQKLKKLIKNKKLENNIIMYGFMNPKQIEPIMLNSSLYIMSSISESFGLVVIEAFSYGVPVVAFDTARGPHEIIDNHLNGFFIKDRDKQIMANKIIKLLNNKSQLKELANNAHKKAYQFSPNTVKEKWLDFLSSVEKK